MISNMFPIFPGSSVYNKPFCLSLSLHLKEYEVFLSSFSLNPRPIPYGCLLALYAGHSFDLWMLFQDFPVLFPSP
jgi:hypothetical protein